MPEPIDNTNEVWKEIPGWEGYYAVSTHGRIKSLTRTIVGSRYVRRFPGSVMASGRRRGYVGCALSKNGRRTHVRLHQLVLETFVGPRPEGMEACHYNGNRSDNCIQNLRWDTRKNNHADKKRHGTNSHGLKLRQDQVDEIRRLYATGVKSPALAKMFGVWQPTISGILLGTYWSASFKMPVPSGQSRLPLVYRRLLASKNM